MKLETVVEQTIERVGRQIILGAPLGLGKANPIINAFYQYARQHSDIELTIFTALSLAVPAAGSGLQQRFLQPFLDRHFGENYPHLAYLDDLNNGSLPANIRVCEFYMQSGSGLKKPLRQQQYISSNYTHVARDMRDIGVNVICQLVAARQQPDGSYKYSLSCNPDVTLDLAELLADKREQVALLALVNPELPYMAGDAEISAEFFDAIIDEPSFYYRPFAVPRNPVNTEEHLIGMYASTLIRDGGTLQIGIGALGDAICHATVMRQQQQQQYQQLLQAFQVNQRYPDLLARSGDTQPFSEGLYAASEMFMDGFIHLYKADVLKRKVYDDVGLQMVLNLLSPEQQQPAPLLQALAAEGVINHALRPHEVSWLQHWGLLDQQVQWQNHHLCLEQLKTPANIDQERDFCHRIEPFIGSGLRHGKLLHAAFFLGSQWFYDTLNQMPDAERDQFSMTRVSRINQLYRGEALDRVQRHRARFINTCMKMTLLGAAVSDQLADGQVVSGVGGQYNFVAMAHALDDSRSILMLRSTRYGRKGLQSNIVWEYPHHTIPRHLRDIVITEYGIADLRSKTDEHCIQALLCICDSRFQQELLQQAKAAGKLSADWDIPDRYRHNSPVEMRRRLASLGGDLLPTWPFGSDLHKVEMQLAKALKWLVKQPGWRKLWLIVRPAGANRYPEAIARMQLDAAIGLRQKIWRRLLLHSLKNTTI